jgi:ferredoxin
VAGESGARYVINEDCILCGTCIEECPECCIAAGDEIAVIDQVRCTACGVCYDLCAPGAVLLLRADDALAHSAAFTHGSGTRRTPDGGAS